MFSRTLAGERSCGREQRNIANPGGGERLGARGRRRAGGEHVVDQEHASGHARTSKGFECAPHRLASFLARASRLRRRRDRTTRQPNDGEIEPRPDGDGERSSLVVTAFRQPAACERHPRDRVGRRRTRGDHGIGQRRRHASPPRELQPMDRRAGRTRVQERRPGRLHRRRRAVATPGHERRTRSATTFAPRWCQGDEREATVVAERPRTHAAARTPRREDDVERPGEHGETVARATDMPADRATAGGARSAPGAHARRSTVASGSASLDTPSRDHSRSPDRSRTPGW